MTEEVLILGGGFLGVNTALELLDSDRDVKLVGENLSHEYIPGTIELIRGRASEEELRVDLKEFLNQTEVETVREKVVDIRPEEKVVETRRGLHGYDELVIGLGGQPRTFGIDISNAHSVWSIEETRKLNEDLEEAERAVIVGSGYTGLETAGEIAEKGIETVVVEAKTRPAPGLTEESSEKLLEIMHQEGIDFRGGRQVKEITEEGVSLQEDGIIEADVVVWCGGVEAASVVRDSLDTDAAGVDVNNGLSVKQQEDIFAGGDNADTGTLKTAHNAMAQADIIAENIQRGNRELKRLDSDRSPIAVSIGDRGAIVYNQDVIWTGFPSRRLKDLVRKYYFLRLRWKKLKAKYL